jgi:hypothetical protein
VQSSWGRNDDNEVGEKEDFLGLKLQMETICEVESFLETECSKKFIRAGGN